MATKFTYSDILLCGIFSHFYFSGNLPSCTTCSSDWYNLYTFNIHYCFTLQNYTKERAYIATQGMYALLFIITQYGHVQLIK